MTLILIGGGGHAGAVAEVARSAGWLVVGVLAPEDSPVPSGLVRLGDDSWIDQAPEDAAFHVAFGSRPGRGAREALFEKLSIRGLSLPAIVAATAIVSPSASLGAGAIAMHAAVINTAARVGLNCIINTRALVEHDCAIGDHTHIAPGALLGGGVQVGNCCFVGAGAVILPGVSIADGVLIGAGAVVVRSIGEPGGTWSGNPARRHQ